jgi:hypothetical protein
MDLLDLRRAALGLRVEPQKSSLKIPVLKDGASSSGAYQ